MDLRACDAVRYLFRHERDTTARHSEIRRHIARPREHRLYPGASAVHDLLLADRRIQWRWECRRSDLVLHDIRRIPGAVSRQWLRDELADPVPARAADPRCARGRAEYGDSVVRYGGADCGAVDHDRAWDARSGKSSLRRRDSIGRPEL